ncbi:MAG: ABC transporter permease [Inhella sp.]
MHALLALVQKDLRIFLSDRRALLLTLLAPILIAAFFGSLFGGSGSAKKAGVGLAITDWDRSPVSQALVAALRADPHLKLQELDAESAQALVRAGKLDAAVQLPPGFGQQAGRALFGAGPRPVILLHHDPSKAMGLAVVQGLLAQHAMRSLSQAAFQADGSLMADLRDQVQRAQGLAAAEQQELLALFDQVARVQRVSAPAAGASAPSGVSGGLRQPFDTELVAAQAPQQAGYNAYAHSFAGMGVQFILMLGVDMGVALLLLRRQDLWKRLRAAPVSRAVLLGSRLLSSALIALGVFTVLMAVAIAVFGVRVQGSWLGLALVLLGFALFTAAFGLAVAALGRTPEATRGLAIVATLLLVMLGGAWVPAFMFPDWLQQLTLLVPTRWAIDGLDAMTWRGLGLAEAARQAGLLGAAALLMGGLAWWRFEWAEE